MTASSKLLRTPATASASVVICLISLKVGFAIVAVLSMVLLKCTSLKSIVLKLMLTILRSLASVPLCETSKLLVPALTIKGSVASTLTYGSVIIIVIIIVRAIICISFICLLGFRWVLSLFLRFSFRLTPTSGLFWFCAFKWLGYFTLFFVHQMCYMGIQSRYCCTCCHQWHCGSRWITFSYYVFARFCFIFYISPIFAYNQICLYHCRHCFYELFLFGLFFLVYHIT